MVIKTRRIRSTGHVAFVWEKRDVYMVWWGNLMERAHLGDPGVDGRITVRRNFRK